MNSCLGLRVGEWGVTNNGHRVSFGDDENVKMDCGDSLCNWEYTKNH